MAEATVEKKSALESFTEVIMKVTAPLAKFANLAPIAAIQNGLVAAMPLIIIGSLFLVLGLFGSSDIGGVVLLPFLSPISQQLMTMNSLTMNFLAIYCSISIPMAYAERIGLDTKTCGVLGLAIFFVFTLDGVSDNMIPTTAFSATGLFTVIISSLVGVTIYKWVLDRHIVISMPDGVPPAVGNAFTSLIPFAIVLTLAWLVRTVMEFDMVAFLTSVLTPLIQGADNIGMYVTERFVNALLWSVGLHGDNMWTTPIFQPLTTTWAADNAAAIAAGDALPHIWTLNGIDRISTWPALAWPVIFLMIRSKVPYLRTLGWTCLPPAIFTIVEPVIFGLPLAFNPFLIVPFLITSILASLFTYAFFALGLCARFFATLPWATPPFILGPLGTGDMMSLIVPIACFAIGLVVYLPFWRLFEKNQLEQEQANAEAEVTEQVEAAQQMERVAGEAEVALKPLEAVEKEIDLTGEPQFKDVDNRELQNAGVPSSDEQKSHSEETVDRK